MSRFMRISDHCILDINDLITIGYEKENIINTPGIDTEKPKWFIYANGKVLSPTRYNFDTIEELLEYYMPIENALMEE